jgi:putative transcriptional regulator
MPITVTLDIMLARRKIRAKDLATKVGISETQMSLLRTGKVKGMRFDTLSKLCFLLECQPGDLIEYRPDAADLEAPSEAG